MKRQKIETARKLITFSERLSAVMNEKKISKSDLARAGGVGLSTITGYMNASSQPSLLVLSNWVQEFGINGHWLLTGAGEFMFDRGKISIRRLGQHAPADAACVLGPDTQPVGQVVPVHGTTGAGAASERWEPDEPICHICIPITYYRESILVVRVDGRSMEPDIKKGAFVALDTAQVHVIPGEVYGIRVPYEGLTLKSVFIDHLDGALVLKSRNPEYPETRVPINGNDGLVVGRAMFVMQTL